MNHIYLISGLGADKRAFQRLKFEGFDITCLDWIKPVKNESLEDYCVRLVDQIKHFRPILIGLSFGGVVAIEIAKIIEVEKIILISSVETKNQLPLYLRIVGILGLCKLVPISKLKTSGALSEWFFGVTCEQEKKMLNEILADTNPDFLLWAFAKIPTWQNKRVHPNTFHIHGEEDRIFPIKNIKPVIPIQGGSHFMILNRAEEISRKVNEILMLS